MESEKKVCQRLVDQVSSLRWDLICPSQLMGLKKTIHLGVSSSWDSRPVISVRSTESSTVTTMHCCERRLNCSTRCETVNISLRSWKDCQWLSICWVTLSCEGMVVTSSLETELSSHTREVSMWRLIYGIQRGTSSFFWGSSIKCSILSNIVKSHTKTTLSMCQVKDHVTPNLDLRIPTVCVLFSTLFQKHVSYFTVYVMLL